MHIKTILNGAVFMAVVTVLSGCAVAFSPKYQQVTITSTTPGATIRFEGDSVGTGTARVKLNKYCVYNTFTAEKAGYKSESYCVTLDSYAPTIALTVIDALAFVVPTALIVRNIQADGSVTLGRDLAFIPGIFLFGLVLTDLQHVKTHRYEKDPEIPALKPYEKRKDDEKYLLVNKTDVDVLSKNQRSVTYSRLSKYLDEGGGGRSKHSRSYGSENLKVENTSFTSTLNYALRKMSFVDTANTVFPNINNSLYLDATIKKITFHEVRSKYQNLEAYSGDKAKVMPNHLFAIELAIDWDVLDYYKQKKATIRTVERSDLVTLVYDPSSGEISSAVYNALKDNMESSIMSLRRQLADKKMLKLTNEKVASEVIELIRPENVSAKKADFNKCCVAVSVEGGLASGTVISQDGYIVTSYHNVVGKEKVVVVFEDSTTAEGKVVRSSATSDMALIKVDKEGLTPVMLSEESDPEIGVDVWAVGITNKEDKVMRLSHGIISGLRNDGGITMLQTDASLTTSNGGGPLINEHGIASGIISFKVLGRGVEGIGFALSAKDVLEKLSLKYK